MGEKCLAINDGGVIGYLLGKKLTFTPNLYLTQKLIQSGSQALIRKVKQSFMRKHKTISSRPWEGQECLKEDTKGIKH